MFTIGHDTLYPLGEGGMVLIPAQSGAFGISDNRGHIIQFYDIARMGGSFDQISYLMGENYFQWSDGGLENGLAATGDSLSVLEETDPIPEIIPEE